MKKLVFASLMMGISLGTFAQSKFPVVDKSSLDESYYPANYPILKIQDKATEPLLARVVYSRPLKNGRKVFGELVEYGTIWRLGANEATELELFKDAKIGASKVKKGRYTLYAIPEENKWTLILNKETDTWGAFRYDQKKDVARVDLPVQRTGEDLEAFSMYFEKNNGTIHLVIGWDDESVRMPIQF
ncbi:DUF2911 domain-containing protein [Flavihumibacter petaseus]|nr:DUF2911 domain-containing protein [Flavihumibacter petaseus]